MEWWVACQEWGKMEPTNDNPKMDPAIEEYAAFEEKVKRTVFVDNLSPLATEAVLKAAFNQFGDVTSVYLFPNYIEPNNTACAALVEMQTPNQAENIIYEVSNSPFMISGMPRPVRARAAEIEMFDDRPRKPGRKIELRWVAPNDPDFEVAKKMTALVHKHAAEADFLMKHQLEEEEKLAKKQDLALQAHHKKYKLLESVSGSGPNGSANQLAQHYGMPFGDSKKWH
nr:Splicing factor-like protein [Ipomoea batatas]